MVAAAVAVIVACAGAVLQAQRAAAAVKRGQALYSGQAPLPGRLAGHELALPPAATRCANCHEGGKPGAVAGPGVPYAAALTAAALATPRARRGGPPSAYDGRALCSLLRSGLDPAQVMIDTTMPRYQPTDMQCEDLWHFLNSR